MATTPKKSVKKASATKSKVIASPKKRSLSKKQWGIVGLAAIALLSVGTYFGIQAYQDTTADAASGWTKVASNGIVPNDPRSPTSAEKSENAKNYAKWTIYACKSGNTVKAKTTITSIAGSFKNNVIYSEAYATTGVGSSKGNTGVKASKAGVSGISKKYTTSKSQVYVSGSVDGDGYFTTMNGSRYKVTISNLAKCQ